MNKKITVKRSDGRVMYCILNGTDDLQAQFNLWLFGQANPSGGYKALFDGKSLEITDLMAYDRVEKFDVLLIEDTAEATGNGWFYPDGN